MPPTITEASRYQQLRGHLAYLKLADAAEALPAVLDTAKTENLSPTATLETLQARYLGTQRCQDCNTWCRRLGAGGTCPHCDDIVAVKDLVADNQYSALPRQTGKASRAPRPTTG